MNDRSVLSYLSVGVVSTSMSSAGRRLSSRAHNRSDNSFISASEGGAAGNWVWEEKSLINIYCTVILNSMGLLLLSSYTNSYWCWGWHVSRNLLIILYIKIDNSFVGVAGTSSLSYCPKGTICMPYMAKYLIKRPINWYNFYNFRGNCVSEFLFKI